MEKELYSAIIYEKPRTKKNSQQIFINPKTRRPFITSSKAYKEYEKASLKYLKEPPHIATPCNVKMVFYMPTRGKVDLSNLQSACLDILVLAGVIEDDNSRIVVTHDGSITKLDRDNPRTEITITEYEVNENDNSTTAEGKNDRRN